MDQEYKKEEAVGFNKSVEEEDSFKGSYWQNFNILKRSGIVGVNAHGEYGENSDKHYHKMINNWNPGFWDEIRKKKITPSRIYNGSQLGLFYAKLPNHVYVSK